MDIPAEIWKQSPYAAAMAFVGWQMIRSNRAIHKELKASQEKMNSENQAAQQRQLDECMHARRDQTAATIGITQAVSRMETTLRDWLAKN